jgi:hypothetical protein
MRRAIAIFVLISSVVIQVSCNQNEPHVFNKGEISRFDDLLNSNTYEWTLSDSGKSNNGKVLEELVNVYPEGVTWERCYYSGKFSKTVDRWIIVNGDNCLVYEMLEWSWGGKFGYVNGVRTHSLDQFNLALKKDGGTSFSGEN